MTATSRPDLNVLFITADDLNGDSVGYAGSRVPDITPNLDRLAAESLYFTRAHVTSAVCVPSRCVLATGLYPHHSGMEGFTHLPENHPRPVTLMDVLSKAGCLTGILGKVFHCAPTYDAPWDMAHDQDELGHGRNPAIYARYMSEFLARARQEQRPFYLMVNAHDPHRPFSGSADEKKRWSDPITPPSRTYSPDEIVVPGFLPDLPDVRTEIAEYFSSVRRCDDVVGAVLRVLDESGLRDNTLVMFLSDNGMALPFSKTNCYLQSTHTPWLVRWPGVTRPGMIDATHFISGIDYMPTILDAMRLPVPAGLDGRSFVPVLRGGQQAGRELVFTQFHETAGRARYPMRCVQDGRYGYIFSPWSDGKRVFKNESQSGLTFKAMQAAAPADPEIAARVKLFLYREVEELYDLQADPDGLHNLIRDPAHAAAANRLRAALADWMKATGDHALAAFEHRDSPEALARFMEEDAKRMLPRPPNKASGSAGE